jgi:hypothetical protein
MLGEKATALRNRPAPAEKIFLQGDGGRLDLIA